MGEQPNNANGNNYARQRDIDRVRNDHAKEVDRLERTIAERLDRAQELYFKSHADLCREVSSLDERVDKVESVIDQQRGARNLIYALIGSNMLLALMAAVTIFHIAGII